MSSVIVLAAICTRGAAVGNFAGVHSGSLRRGARADVGVPGHIFERDQLSPPEFGALKVPTGFRN